MHRGYDAYESIGAMQHTVHTPYRLMHHIPHTSHPCTHQIGLSAKKIITHNVCILFPMHHIQEYDVWAISHVDNTMHGEYDVWENTCMMHASTMWFIGIVWDHYDALGI